MTDGAQEHGWDDLAKALASESPDLVLVISPAGYLMHLSAAGEAFMGQPAAELVGRSVLPWIHPEDLPLAIATHRAAIRGEQRRLVCYRVRDGKGEYRWLEVSKQPLRDPGTGHVPAVLEITRDVTERRRMEDRLAASEASLKMAQRVGRIGSWELVLATDAVTWSDEMFRLFGFEPGAITPTRASILEMVVPEDREAVRAGVARALASEGGAEAVYQGRLRRADGTIRVMSIVAARVEDPARGPLLVGVSRDVTEEEALREAEREGRRALERALEAAQEASRAKGEFLANMSHELRTPLNAIIGYAELVGEEAEDLGAAALAPDLEKIRGAATHLLGLINDVLALATLEDGAGAEVATEAAPAALVDEALAAVEPLMRANGNRQEVRLAPGLPAFRGDVAKVRQCLANVLDNAHKFTHQGLVTVEVRAEVQDGAPWLRFEVADTGIGMAKADQERVFEQFVQVEAGATRRYGGTGLGLTLVRAFAHAMGGEVSLRSAPGCGTRVTLRLPAGAGVPAGG